MAATPNQNLEILSTQEKVKSKKDQMIENLKMEMLKGLKLDEKLIKRNSLMQEISKARENAIFPKQINFGGKIIEIKEQGKYKSFIDQYKEINIKNSANKEAILKQLDKELTEHIILDEKKMIEFSSTENFEGRTAEEEAKNSFERLNSRGNKYDKKIELIKKTDGEITHFVIKRTKKQLEELERAEKAYETVHKLETEEKKIDLGMVQGPQQKIQKTLNKQEVTEQNKETSQNMEETEEKEIGSVVELTATISDTTQITRAMAERKAGEKLREIYKKTSRYKPRSWATKAKLFLGRGYMKNNYVRKEMGEIGKDIERDPTSVSAADRHEMEKENNFNDTIEQVGVIDETNFPNTYKEIQTLADRLMNNNISPDNFKKDFRIILMEKKPDGDKLDTIIKHNNLQKMSSNVVDKILAFRDHQKLTKEITTYMFQHPAIAKQDPIAENKFNIFARERIVNYFKDYKKNPAFLKTLNIKFDDADAMKKLSNYQAHSGALTMIAKQTMMLKVQILAKGEEAYDVKQETNTMTKIGDWLDKPISDDSRFGKWLEKHPFAKNAFGTLRGVTKLGAMITPAILLAPLGPLAIASGAGGMAAMKTLFKKYSHYNKEHIGYQRNQAVNMFKNREEREKLLKEIGKMHPATSFFYYYFGLGEKANKVRQFKDYILTTHDKLENSAELAEDLEKSLNKTELSTIEIDNLERKIAKGLARLNYHKQTGQNFLGSENKDKAEKEYQQIYRLVLTGSMRLNKELKSFEGTNEYINEMKVMNGNPDNKDDIGYLKSRKRFKYRQTEKALLGAVKAGGVAFGLSYLATSLASTKASAHTLSDQSHIADNFVLGKHQLANDNSIYMQSKDFFGNPNAGNQTISFNYGGGTDATHLIPGHLTQTEYLSKVNEVQANIMHMTNLSTTTKTNLINELHRKPREHVRAQKGFTNDYLQGMRCSEIIEQTAKGLNESGANAGNITLQAAYNGSVYDIVGKTYNNAGERIAQGALEYSKNIVTPENIIPIPIPGFMNTFKQPDQTEEDKKTTNDYTGRKTRSPAPRTDIGGSNNTPSRRRSGESTEDLQFTNANN